MEFIQGQRWVVDSEPELGLGVVISASGRRVSVSFPQAQCERLYAMAQAPLTRIVFSVGDTITLNDGQTASVVAVFDNKGLAFYDIGEKIVPETELSGVIQLNQPLMRLMTGQLDAAKWFYFRRQLDDAMARTWQSGLKGLLGVRASVIPHQVYVAYSACEREQVRVLLADEVGLGKTLEAGMILSRLLKLERISRALIVVPEPLQIQWLVELIRRFNIRPELYSGPEHDFTSGQIHLVPHTLLGSAADALVAAEFHCVVVDEAHHLLPNTCAFEGLQALSRACPHMILLTATPEQLGVASHFARLQLLDAAKYTCLQDFTAQEQGFAEINQLIRGLPATRPQLLQRFSLDPTLSQEALISQVLDCQGVGRVLFRNTRASVKGFPARCVTAYPLAENTWPVRFEWLAQWLKRHTQEKVLVICHAKEQVLEAEQYLWQKHGIDVALFHEDLSLMERDRAAAYFSASGDSGAAVLICSEIGSEGRNFQFSHHLVCLDVPKHPDLLEQRIGRLDRIGQTQDVCIHFPLAPHSPCSQLFQWYHQVLNSIASQNPAAGVVHDEFWPLYTANPENPAIVQQAQEKVQQLQTAIAEGRDALLEMNSCRQPIANEWVQRIEAFEQQTPFELVDLASDVLNFHFEETQDGAYSLIPADNMLIASLPGIPLEGVEVTFSRALAQSREDVLFITWDSPFIIGLWELLHHSELGCASVALLPSKQLPAGKCLLEACFDVVVQSNQAAACLPFLSAGSIRSLAFEGGDKNLAQHLPEKALQNTLVGVDKKLARKMIASKKEAIPVWFKTVEGFAQQEWQSMQAQALAKVADYFNVETHRLRYLAQHSGAPLQPDIQALQEQQQRLITALGQHTHLQLSALRFIVTTEPAHV